MQIRLDKLVSEAGALTRQEAKKLIGAGLVAIDGQVVKKIDYKTDTSANLTIKGKAAGYEKYVYIMLNKPKGVVSASTDKNDVTVVDLVKNAFPKRNLFPAGRLDKASTGFVLLTDDGQFAHDILSPKKHVPKTYIVTLDAPITKHVIQAFSEGVTLADGQKMKPASIKSLEKDTIVEIVLNQGVYHQIKRMLGVFDIGVNELHRTKIGQLELPQSLMPGEFVKLTKNQVLKIGNCELTEN